MIESNMLTIPIEEIDYGDRGRKDYKDIALLASSIRERGLIHPIAVMPHPIGKGYLLLAGGRRLRAHEFLGRKEIECKLFPGGIGELERRLVELSENIHREQLEYHEKIAMTQKIRDLMVQIYGRKKSTAPDAPGVSDRDVAKMMGITHAKLSQDLNLAKAMDTFEEVDWTQCKNRQEAIRLKDSISRVIIRQEAAKEFEREVASPTGAAPEAWKQKLASFYIVGDFFEQAENLPAEAFKLVEIDPPYSIDLQTKKDKKTSYGRYSYGPDGYNEIDKKHYPKFLLQTFQACYRVMSRDSWLVCWLAPNPWYQTVMRLLKATGFICRGLPCVWTKGVGQTNTPRRHLGSSCEFFLYARKGDPAIANMGRTNQFDYKPASSHKKEHPTERPVDLMEDIVTTFAIEGDRILVPFAGSGSTLIAAYNKKMIPIGFDLGEIHKEAFVARLMGG